MAAQDIGVAYVHVEPSGRGFGKSIEGDIDDVLKVIRDATMKLAGQGYRTDVVIRLDIRPGFEGQIHAKQALVDEILSE